jgi:hypothetical protein
MRIRILKNLTTIALILLALFVATRAFEIPHKDSYETPNSHVFSAGNAPEEVRTQITQSLRAFQEGYKKRDTARVDEFVADLFSRDNVLILGTMPREIFIGPKEATDLIFDDWDSWGDCTFQVENAHISTYGDVGWVATIGFVEFDLSSWLTLPLRFTAVLVRENGVWKFRQTQFQFDLDLSFYLLTIVLLLLALVVSTVTLLLHSARLVRRTSRTSTS